MSGGAIPDRARVHPCERIAGRIRVPGDKSISHRLAILAGISRGTSRIRGFLASEDCLNTLRAMESLGAGVRRDEGSGEIAVEGRRLSAPPGPLDLGNSGTGIRLIAGLAAGQPMTVELTGDESLRSRPMRRIKEPLERMGARVELLGDGRCAPIRVTGGRLRGIRYPLPVASAQVKSCVLLAGLFARGATVVEEPLPARDHTERLLAAAGIPIAVEGLTVSLEGFGPDGPVLGARSWAVPGDFSSAAFWLVAAAAGNGGLVSVEGVGLNPRRTALLDVLARMGARIEVVAGGDPGAAEPMGEVRVSGGGLRGTEIGGAEIPNLIDEIPALAVAAALAEGRTVVRDAAELRVKESDRIATVAAGLKAFGVTVEERPDGMAIEGGRPPAGGVTVDSHGDHRIAMAMAVLALKSREPVAILRTACIATSYPEFWNDLRSLGGHVEQAG